LVIDSSITTVGEGTEYIHNFFDGFSNVTSVTFPTTLLNIGDTSFASNNDTFINNQRLVSVNLPNNITVYTKAGGECGLFRYCSSLVQVTLGAMFTNNITKTGTGYGTFFGCTALTDVSFGDPDPEFLYDTIEGQCFYGCLSLKQISLPTTIQLLDEECFAYSGLTSIDLSGTQITSLPLGVFSYCSSLTTITLPIFLSSINNTFHGCYALANVYLSYSLPLFSSIENINMMDYKPTSPSLYFPLTPSDSHYNTFLDVLGITDTTPTLFFFST
jgi:hypothetical protein